LRPGIQNKVIENQAGFPCLYVLRFYPGTFPQGESGAMVTIEVAKHEDGDRSTLLAFGHRNGHLHQEAHVPLNPRQIHGLHGCMAQGLGSHAVTDGSDPDHRYDGEKDVEASEVSPGLSITHVVFLGSLGS
jgi:hypothetical protein